MTDTEQRRRVQVRMAQQAYRQRKEVAFSSLRKECDHLKDCLDNMGKLFDQLFDFTVKSNLSARDEVLVRELKESSKRFRKETKESADGDENMDSQSNRSSTAGNKCVPPEVLENRGVPDHSHSSKSPVRSSYPDVLSETLNLNPCTWQPSNNKSELAKDDFLSFSVRFRYEGLKRGYSLITTPDVPYSAVFRAFKFCIFSNSRDQIQRQIEFLLHESTKSTQETLNNSTFETMQSDKWWEDIIVPGKAPTHPLLTASSAFLPSWPSNEAHLEDTNLVVAPPDELQEYVDADGVEQYLSQKGLSIVPGSPYVPLRTAGSPWNKTTERSMFDEMSGEKNIMLIVGKLLHGKLGSTFPSALENDS